MKPKKDELEPILSSGEANLSAPEPVCSILRRHRKQMGQDLKTVAQALRIRYVYLEAIEQGRYDALPGSTYALGFIKTYAEYLDLDEEEIVQRFRDDVDGLDDQTQLVFPSPVPEGKVPGGAILIVALIMGSLAYGGWYGLSSRDSSLVDFIPALPDRLMALFDDETSGGSPEPQMAETEMAETQTAETQTAATEPTATEPAATEGTPPENTAPENTAPENTAAENSAAETTTAGVSSQAAATSGETASTPATTTDTAASSQTASGTAPEPQTATSSVSSASQAQSQTSAAAAGSSAPSGTTVISSLSVTNQPATDQVSSDQAAEAQAAASTEIPAAPAAPVPAQTASVPDATQPQVYGEDNADARIILRATQDAWVQVRDGSDELLLTRVLREGDVYRVPNEEGLTLLTGNAGGIEVLVDGTLMAPLGPVGSVRRDLALDPQVLLAGTAQR